MRFVFERVDAELALDSADGPVDFSKDKRGNRRILFVDADGSRKTIYLGKTPQKTTENIKTRVEYLVASKRSGIAWDGPTSQWVASLGDELADKLARLGLIPVRERATLGQFLREFQEKRIDVKGATHVVWGQAIRNLLEHFGENRPVQSITAGNADDFKMYLIGQKLAPTTIHKRLSFCRQFFRAMKRRGLISESPFLEVRMKAISDPDRQRFITREETALILEACPDHDWRTIVGLTRYGGLRCPSEVLSVKIEDVNWERNRLVVTSPKTEHHDGKQSRVIPIFPQLAPILLEACERAPEGAVYLVDAKYRIQSIRPEGWKNCNLRSRFTRIVKRAGLAPWPRLFHNLRASRETELAKEHPMHVVTAWLGNTPKIALKHYLQVTEEDFHKATQNGTQQVSATARNITQTQGVTAPLHQNADGDNSGPCDDVQAIAGGCDKSFSDKDLRQAEGTGLEPATPERGTTFPVWPLANSHTLLKDTAKS